jgi:hypothetical protein
MPYQRNREPRFAREVAAVFSIGRRAFVHSPDRYDARASLSDEASTSVVEMLGDGAQVEILGWAPGGSATRYFVRVVASDVVGWLAAGQLRDTEERPPDGIRTPAAATWIPVVTPSKSGR